MGLSAPPHFFGSRMRILVHSRTLLSAKLFLRCNILIIVLFSKNIFFSVEHTIDEKFLSKKYDFLLIVVGFSIELWVCSLVRPMINTPLLKSRIDGYH